MNKPCSSLAELGSFGHMFLALELRIEEMGYGIYLCMELSSAEARYMLGVSLNSGPVERSLCESVKLKPG